MSEYCRKLDAVAQSKYLEKLKLLDPEEKDDLSYCSYTRGGTTEDRAIIFYCRIFVQNGVP